MRKLLLMVLWLSSSFALLANDKAETKLCELIQKQQYSKALKQLERIDKISEETYVLLPYLEAFIDYASNNTTSYEVYLKLSYWYANELAAHGDLASLIPEQFEEAQSCYSTAAEIYKELEGDTSALYLNQQRTLRDFYAENNKLEQATLISDELIHIDKSKSDTVLLIGDYNTLGVVYYRMGENMLSDSIFDKTDKLIHKLSNKDLRNYLDIACNEVRATLYLAHRDYDRALLKYKQLINRWRTYYGPNDQVEAIYNLQIGTILVQLKQFVEARNVIEPAYITLKNSNQEQLKGMCRTASLLLARLYLLDGKFKNAKHVLLPIVSNKPEIMSDQFASHVACLSELAVVHYMLQDYAEAYKYINECVEAYEFFYEHGSAKYEYPNSLYQKAMILERMNNLTESFATAQKSYYMQKQLVWQHLSFLSTEQREEYWQTIQYRFSNEYPQLYYKCSTSIDSIGRQAYDNELFYKGILLSTTNQIQNAILESGDSVLISLYNELQQIQSILISDNAPKDLSELLKRKADIDKLLTNKSSIYRTANETINAGWKDVQKCLHPNQIAIELTSFNLFHNTYTDSTMYCAILLRHDSESPKLIPLFEEKEISSYLSSTNTTYDFKTNGNIVSQLVWSKILPMIKEGETIYFAPSGLLHQLAIEHLPYDDTRTMADVFNMVRLSSTREIITNKTQSHHATATVYGGIVYDAIRNDYPFGC